MTGNFFDSVINIVCDHYCVQVINAKVERALAQSQRQPTHTEGGLHTRIKNKQNATFANRDDMLLQCGQSSKMSYLKQYSEYPFVNMAKCRKVLSILDECGEALSAELATQKLVCTKRTAVVCSKKSYY